MRLARLAHLTVHGASDLPTFRMEAGNVLVESGGVRNHPGQLILNASVPLVRRPTVTPAGIRLPVTPRREAEDAIEAAADTIAVSVGLRRSISSPNPYVGLIPETTAELDWMNATPGFSPLPLRQVASARTLDKPLAVLGPLLEDRRDGIGLMAEALAHTHATGQFHDLMRVFERAFALAPGALLDPLSNFLRGARLGYSRREIHKWLELRGPATHADRRPVVLSEPDLRAPVLRMEQAAYDVLINKEAWRDRSPRRRNRWRPTTGTRTSSGAVWIEQGSGHGEALRAQLLDGFGVYPMNLEAGLGRLPDGVWWRGATEY